MMMSRHFEYFLPETIKIVKNPFVINVSFSVPAFLYLSIGNLLDFLYKRDIIILYNEKLW